MHARITHLQFLIWAAIVIDQLMIAAFSKRRRNTSLAIYLGILAANSLWQLPVAVFASAAVYYKAYWVGCFIDYGAQMFLVVAVYAAIRSTGIPGKHTIPLQIMGAAFFAFAILTLPFPLTNVTPISWKWLLAVDHLVFYWLSLMLMVAPAYAWIIDAAKDHRLLLIYLGFSINTTVRALAVDAAIQTHLLHRFTHAPEITYLLATILWIWSCYFTPAVHRLDPAQAEQLKAALRERRSSIDAAISLREV
jgi:hypothetical protein